MTKYLSRKGKLPAHWHNSVRQSSGRPGFNPRSSRIKTSKMVRDASLLNTQHFLVRIKSKWINSEKRVVPSLYFGVIAIELGDFGSSSTTVGQLIPEGSSKSYKPHHAFRFVTYLSTMYAPKLEQKYELV